MQYFDVDKEMSWYFDSGKPLTKIIHKPHRGKKINQLTLDGKFIRQFDSCALAAIAVNRHRSCIKDCAHGKINQSGGYRWEFAN